MRRDPIVMLNYDLRWPGLFAEQRDRLEPLLHPWLTSPIEHIGSTSIPGLRAKPIIDMLALVEDHGAFADALPLFERLGWLVAPEPGDADGRKYSVCHPSIKQRTHHLHVVERRGEGWADWILFRDYLRAHRQVAREYGEVKQRLADAHPGDRPAYRAAKAPWIQATLVEARRWRHA